MKPIDIRDHNFQSLRGELHERCQQVLMALAVHGPCTTRQLAQRAQMDLLYVRPRITDLGSVGLVLCVGREAGEGVYRVASPQEWEGWRSTAVETLTSGQLQLM